MCDSYCDHYPRHEGKPELGEDYADYEKNLLRNAKKSARKYENTVSKRVSGIAACLILFFSCLMAVVWTSVISYDKPLDHTDTRDTITTESASDVSSESRWTTASDSLTEPQRTTDSDTSSKQTTASDTTSGTRGTSTSGSATESGSAPPQPPEPEKSATYTFYEISSDGLMLEATIHGYQTRREGFYVKNHEYILVDIKLTNTTAVDFYQWLPTGCRNGAEIHNHEIGFDLSSGQTKLRSSSFGFDCTHCNDWWTIEAGTSYEWQLKLAVGSESYGSDYDLPADGSGGILLYGPDIFTDSVCVFRGFISFAYQRENEFGSYENDRSVSVPLSIKVIYVSSTANP
jgi:hypothetical protein